MVHFVQEGAMVRTIGVRSLRPRLSRAVDEVSEHLDRYVITKRGKPVAVLMGVDDYEGLLETLEIMSDKSLMKRIRRAERELKKGKGRSLEEINRDLALV